ncbi:receptor-type tyrosine-protein phosphatase eta-like [Rana temporaria]|uniref:receptor-type tyrosine-protein phosphatase eta-like n=1 Tax=Rana temporaria TaxID=8407 RepID=UPI001AACB8D1|nr:receptor-type tyrosine-protein phosphatase eta-like [Rana temporaria]
MFVSFCPTDPTPPQTLNFNTIGSDGITVSWKDPANMSGLAKSYNITWNPSSNTGTVASYVPNVTLQNLTSATNYTITVLTVGARGYQSTPVTGWRVTSPLEQPGSVQVVRSTSGDSMNVTFQGFDTKNGPIVAYAIIVTTDLNGSKPPEGVLKKTNNDFKNGLTKTYVTSVIEQNSQRSTRSNEISAHVGDGSQSRGYVNAPLDPKLQYRVGVAGFTQVNYSSTTNTINEDQSTAIITSYNGSPSATTTTTAATTNATSASTKPNNTNATVTNTSIASNSGSPSSNATTATTTTTTKASNTGTRHVQCMICGLPLSHLQLMTYLLCAFYYFVHM